jgi:hypothetical protein
MSKPAVPQPQKPTDLPNAQPPSPANLVSRTPRAPGSRPVNAEDEHLELPHERDQRSNMTDGKPRREMQQAARDIENGLVDTDLRATPGLDAEQRARDVPGPNGPPTPKDHHSGPSDAPITKKPQGAEPSAPKPKPQR